MMPELLMCIKRQLCERGIKHQQSPENGVRSTTPQAAGPLQGDWEKRREGEEMENEIENNLAISVNTNQKTEEGES